MTPKILFWDIETAPSLGWTWGKWEQNVLDFKTPWYMLSFAYKWAHDRKVTVRALPDYKRFKRDREDDKDLVRDLHRIMCEADIIVAHNGDRFDIPKATARFIYHRLKPPSPFKSIDTLKILRRFLKLDSNKLDDACAFFSLGRKLPHTGKALWFACMQGDKKAWEKMRHYNARDIRLLEALFERVKPYATNLPNLNIYTGSKGCPTCQSHNVIKRGLYYVQKIVRQRLHCKDCGAWFAGDRVK